MAIASDVLQLLRAGATATGRSRAAGPPERSARCLPRGVALERRAQLDPRACAAVQALAWACARHDRVEPLCEQTLLRLAHGGLDGSFAVLVRDAAGTPVGYAQAMRLEN